MAFIYNLTDTWNSGATIFTSVKMNVTDTASNAASLLMDLQVGAVSQFNIGKAGVVTIGNNLLAKTDNAFDIGASGANRPRNLYMGSWIRMANTTVAALPAAATAGVGACMLVTDALSPTFGSAVVGGGAVTIPVFSTGTVWNVG